MARPDAYRSLLGGILAVQMDLVTRDGLIEAMNAWVVAKEKPLAQILVERGAMAEEDRSLLEAMVERHVRRHGGDAERSLAAVPVDRALQAELSRLADPDIQATLTRPGSGSAPTAVDETLALAPRPAAAKGSRYRILRPHARGAIGQVSVAVDEELHREVALKEIQPERADDGQSRARFLLEAEITGLLEHPGVVPVYGLGADGNGRPYYAMRFIRGESLKEAIRRFHEADAKPGRDPGARAIAFRELIGRFVEVCNAVSYAHSRGVLHRDLKPANILLGPYGETLVVDWGLAKVVGREEPPDGAGPDGEATLRPVSPGGSGSSETIAGTAIGTPAYMSPEQAEGRLEAIGPASDIYGLGATLYVLVTGRIPFEEGDLPSVLSRVRRGEFPAPRKVNDTAPRPLEAIILKAMANRPQDRYPSVRALADDIKNWLADEPVSAWEEPWWIRERRWLSRHKAAVSALAIIMPVAIVCLSTVAAHERMNNAKLAANNRELDAALARAEAARVRAEQREDLALQAIDNYRRVVESNPDLLTRPDLKLLRRNLLAAPTDFYRQLRDALLREKGEFSQQSTLNQKLMHANFALAWLNAESSSHDEAIRSYKEAISIIEPAAGGRATPFSRELAMIYNNLGNLYVETGAFAEARAAHNRALALRGATSKESPRNDSALSDLAYSHHNLGWLDSKEGKPESSLAHYRKAVELREEVMGRSRDRTAAGMELGKTLGNMGWVLASLGRKDEAIASYRRGAELLEGVVAKQPNVVSTRSDLAQILRSLAESLGDGEARASFRRAEELGRGIVEDAPTVPRFRSELAATLMLHGGLARKWREFESAIAMQEEAVDLGEALAREHPEVVQYQLDLGNSLAHLGLTLVDADRAAQALPHYDRAIDVYQAVVGKNPRDIAAASLVAGLYNNRGLALAKLGRHEEAVADFREAIERERACLDRDPRTAQYRTWLSLHYQNLGKSLRALGRRDEAAAVSRDRFELLRQAPPEQRDPGLHYHVACEMALLVPLVGGGRPDAELTEAERAERASYADRAVEAFRLSIEEDRLTDVGLFASDSDLDPIRSRPDFRRLLDAVMDRNFPAIPWASEVTRPVGPAAAVEPGNNPGGR